MRWPHGSRFFEWRWIAIAIVGALFVQLAWGPLTPARARSDGQAPSGPMASGLAPSLAVVASAASLALMQQTRLTVNGQALPPIQVTLTRQTQPSFTLAASGPLAGDDAPQTARVYVIGNNLYVQPGPRAELLPSQPYVEQRQVFAAFGLWDEWDLLLAAVLSDHARVVAEGNSAPVAYRVNIDPDWANSQLALGRQDPVRVTSASYRVVVDASGGSDHRGLTLAVHGSLALEGPGFTLTTDTGITVDRVNQRTQLALPASLPQPQASR